MGKAKSAAFALLREDVLLITKAVPPGAVCTFKSIGDYMTVVPRHVAYILSQLAAEEQEEVPWFRIVGQGGALGKVKRDVRGRTQEQLLSAEGVGCRGGVVEDFERRFIDASALRSGVESGKRYLDHGG